jgi:hypothetical protein
MQSGLEGRADSVAPTRPELSGRTWLEQRQVANCSGESDGDLRVNGMRFENRTTALFTLLVGESYVPVSEGGWPFFSVGQGS